MLYLTEEQFISTTSELQNSTCFTFSMKSDKDITEIYRKDRLSVATVKTEGWVLTTLRLDNIPVARRQLYKSDVTFEVVDRVLEQELLRLLGVKND